MHRTATSSLVSITLLLGTLSFVAACDDPPPEDRPTVAAEKSTFDLVRDDVPRWLEFAAVEQVESASLEEELNRSVADLQSLGLRHVQVTRSLYAVRSHRPAWIDLAGDSPSSLNPAGEALLTAIEAAQTEHGVFGEDLHAPTITALIEGVEERTESPFEDVRFEAAELKLLREWTDAHPDATPDELARTLARRDGPTPRLAEMIDERAVSLGSASRTRVRLDLYLSDALVEYGMRMRWSNRAFARDVEWPDHLKEPRTNTRVARDDLRRGRRELLARRELQPVFSDPENVAEQLAVLVPPFEQYDRLTRQFRDYARMVSDGGWPLLPDTAKGLKPGDESEHVTVLKKRLAAEGYWKGDSSPKFTESLAEAVKEYQRTHQLWEKGVISRETHASLNVTAERRLAQIRVALQRWRESKIGDDEHYVFVNVPDMHVEVWNDGERKLRFKTVVGSTKRERNPDTGVVEYTRETPSVSSKIEHVVFNPYWWVPAGIVEEEIEPEMAKDPWYLVENDYEWAEDDRGEATLRQKPGPKNALGRVKINFENPYQIYMHDTPEKPLFRYPARAFSHGCIRMQKPMELARYLLEQDGKWDEATVEALLDAGAEKWIKLDDPLPIHIEYYVVRVDDLGRANFLSDLYGRNARRISSALARTDEANAESAPVRTIAE